MELAALIIAVLALLLALAARAKAGGLAAAVEEAERTARRSSENVAEDVATELGKLRKLMAELARGNEVSPDMIEEGRLWRDASPQEATQMVAAGDVHVLDVRTAQETAGGVIPGAQLVPIEELEQRWREVPKSKKTLVYCAGGARSAAACEFMSQKGHVELYNLDGGIGSWTGPVERA